jgi:hypothetical protein
LRTVLVSLAVIFFASHPILQAQETPPPNLAEVEIARSRACVGALARLAELDATLAPYGRRVDRLNVVGRAVSLEQQENAAPFDTNDPLESEVARWFVADSTLAFRYLAEADSAILRERTAARTAMLDRIRQAIREISAEAQGIADQGAQVQEEAQPCVGSILVRSAVLEECATTSSPVCEAAEAPDTAQGPYGFVGDPAELWDLEQYGAWTTAEPLQVDPAGSLAGARTGARSRHGNILITVALAPLIRERSSLGEAEVAEFEANLDSLGFTFEHPRFVMAPAIEFQANLPAPLGGETHYVLHFGDLSGDDLIWTMYAGEGGIVQTLIPATTGDLARLRAGELVSFTALRAPAEGVEAPAEAVFTVSFLQAGQAQNVGSLLDYMSGGGLSRDLLTLVPVGSGGRP